MPRWLQFTVFLSLVLLVYGGTHAYVHARVAAAFHLQGTALWVARALTLVLVVSFPLSRLATYLWVSPVTRVMELAAAVWMGAFLYVFLGTAVVQLASGVLRLAGLWPRLDAWAGHSAAGAGVVGVAALAFATCLWGAWRAAYPVTTELEIPVKALPAALDGFRIAQISDVHLGLLIRHERLGRVVDRVNAFDPDLVVITGDLVDEEASHLEEMVPELRRLRSRHGVLAVTGNHEFFAGVETAVRYGEEAGIHWLRNRKQTVAGAIDVYGIDDPMAGRMEGRRLPAFEEVIGAEAKERPSILLFHQPVRVQKASALGIDLMLSGHTHQGQLWPLAAISRLIYPFNSGLFQVGAMHLYVSRGCGTWGPPMRVGAPPEVVWIRLRRA